MIIHHLGQGRQISVKDRFPGLSPMLTVQLPQRKGSRLGPTSAWLNTALSSWCPHWGKLYYHVSVAILFTSTLGKNKTWQTLCYAYEY